MIVRSAFKCLTCGQVHTLRLGMGAETRQLFRTPCEQCGEDLVVALCVDFDQFQHWVEPVENVEEIDEVVGAPIVNLHANFSIPAGDRNTDFAFPHLFQMQEFAEIAEKAGSLVPAAELLGGKSKERPFRRPDYADEWKHLKTTWSLQRRDRDHLIPHRLTEASKLYYSSDPITSVEDWLHRFAMLQSQPAFEAPLRNIMTRIRPILNKAEFTRYRDHYNEIASQRADRYFDIIKAYFENNDQFSQVHSRVVRGLEIPDGNVASSVDFPAVKMFYGNAFEVFASSVDILAYFGNMLANRPFDEFQNLNLKAYLKLDKPNRFGPLALVPEFDELCVERDNQLRNASHHGGTRFNAETQIITYQAGKGGQGELNEIAYSKYLARSDRLFMQILVLLRIEIILSEVIPGLKRPL